MNEKITKLSEIFTKTWPDSKENAKRLLEHYRQEGKKTLSRRFNNEVRDALDHLYRVASEDDSEVQLANCNSLCEHLRRATVESLEFHVEETLLEIRPVSLPRDWRSITQADFWLRLEYIKKLTVIRPKYTPLILNRIIEGKKHLVEARKSKGNNAQLTVNNLKNALNAFEEIADEVKVNGLNVIFSLLVNTAILFAGIVLTALVKLAINH